MSIDEVLDKLIRDVEASVHALYRGDVRQHTQRVKTDSFRNVARQSLEILLAESDPALVSFEMDVYWVVNGGGNPIALLERYPGRFKMLHLKDSMGPPDHKMVDVGSGTIDFKTILPRAKGIEHYFVEHDEPVDPIASAKASYAYLSKLEF